MSRETALQSPERKRRAKQPPPRAIFSIGDRSASRVTPTARTRRFRSGLSFFESSCRRPGRFLEPS